MKKLYIDAKHSGLSGDMFLAGLLNLIEDPKNILAQLHSLRDVLPDVEELEITQQNVPRMGINVNQLNIKINETKANRKASTLKAALNQFLQQNELSEGARNYAKGVLDTLIHAEAAVHNALHEHIHLHELSSVDTLLDILGVTLVLDALNFFTTEVQMYCSDIPLGGGTIEAAHGTLSIPAPATVEILKGSGIKTKGGPVQSELLTPTGAALLVNLNPLYAVHNPEMEIINIGYGCGQKQFEHFSNTVRLFLGQSSNYITLTRDTLESPLKKYSQQITILSTNVDDISGELIGNLFSSYPQEKVLDIEVYPGITKKNRSSFQVQVLCRPQFQFELIEWMINELGTLGVRYNTVQRICV